jgi:hypothetical protein
VQASFLAPAQSTPPGVRARYGPGKARLGPSKRGGVYQAPKDQAPKDQAPKDQAPKDQAPKELAGAVTAVWAGVGVFMVRLLLVVPSALGRR